MKILKIIAFAIIVIYMLVVAALYFLQTRLIFYPGRLAKDFRYRAVGVNAKELFLTTVDDETINALFFRGERPEVILYFHGNAGDLSGWQFAAEDFAAADYNILIIDYRGYGKSSGSISESGFYKDADAAFEYLRTNGFTNDHIIVYGRSIGSGVATDLASRQRVKGLVLEAPYASLPALAEEKLPFLFPSLYLRYRFNNLEKLKKVTCPVILVHGTEDTLIPPSHSRKLLASIQTKKEMILVEGGSHNDLNSFDRYTKFLNQDLQDFFATSTPPR